MYGRPLGLTHGDQGARYPGLRDGVALPRAVIGASRWDSFSGLDHRFPFILVAEFSTRIAWRGG